MQNNNTKQATTTAKRGFQIANQDWKNFYFFTCSENEKANALTLLKVRNYLRSDGQPNNDVITKQATFFAESLAERIKSRRQARRYGFRKIAANVQRFSELGDTSALYFYITNVYGMVRWYAPYNLQRLPVQREAFAMYLVVFASKFIEKLNSIEAVPPPSAPSPKPEKTAKPKRRTKKAAPPVVPEQDVAVTQEPPGVAVSVPENNSADVVSETANEVVEAADDKPQEVVTEKENRKEEFAYEEEGLGYDEG